MMMTGLKPAEFVELALMLVAVGALSGFFAGIFGIGGGAVLVPVFYECFRLAGVPLEVSMPLCIGTSLAIIIPTSIRSFRAHYARGAVDMETVKAWWLPVLIGVVAGSVTARYAPERLVKIRFVRLAWAPARRLPFAIGYVSLIGAVLAMPTSLFAARLGVRAAHAMSKRMLEMAFAAYLFIAGGRFVISLLNGS